MAGPTIYPHCGKGEQFSSEWVGLIYVPAVASTENLNQKLFEVKDKIINTDVNVHVSVWGDVLVGNDIGATSASVTRNKRKVLADMKDEIISTMVNLHANPIANENASNAKSNAAIKKEKKKNLLVVKSTDRDNK
ncbi:hypothetical protein E2C01_054520 [Portunus trituberculatus]|uniref:Uncharacterized protein n=1 Tax=Portunus trituberculatus TaxID=210409 RepID=A0A5B7GSW2_PORTR|nr:hypothetical protein [Portunus trituberculatus]